MELTSNSRMAQQLLEEAARCSASDIHVEPLDDGARVRLRIDGLLEERFRLAQSAYSTLVTQLKVSSGMDIAEKRIPQDGRWQFAYAERHIDLRLSTLPTIRGEKIVVRLLEREQGLCRLTDLGMSEKNLLLYQKIISASHGLVLLTGPTGSGKTTSLYATLREIQGEALNVMTVEDPVECKLEGVNQVAVNRKAGLDFATGLRSLVRQDPDIIMVGEIRDGETAAMAVQAALTGHLVFSTLHTNSAAGAVTRLIDMGVEPYLLAASLRGVMAQRLVRRICPHCRETCLPAPAEARFLQNERPAAFSPAAAGNLTLARGRGCEHCRGTGYAGRMAVQEIFPVDEYLSELISARAAKPKLLAHAQDLGRRSLYHDAIEKVLQGHTTVQELWRAGISAEEIASGSCEEVVRDAS